MSTARSAFTEAIEEHLSLKKQNSTLEQAMPLARYDVGDPLDRYPGGPNRATDTGTVVIAENVDSFADPTTAAPQMDPSMFAGPSPQQAMEAATSLDPGFADRMFEPLNGMAPMLSLVEDIDEDGFVSSSSPQSEPANADVLRFPGGVGPRDEQQELATTDAAPVSTTPAAGEPAPMQTHVFNAPFEPSEDEQLEAATGEQPVLVIDTDEPLATSGFDEPVEPRAARRSKPRFFGMGRKKQDKGSNGDGWFTDGPRDFNWD